MKKNIPLIALLLLYFLSINCSHKPEQIIGVKIYAYDKSFTDLATEWRKLGINTAFVSSELAANKDFRAALKNKHIATFIICPVFQNPVALKEDSSLFAMTNEGKKAKDDWVEFVCPSRRSYREKQIDTIEKYIKDFQPDGISIDFIRQFVFWEMIYPGRKPESIARACYCDSCVQSFCILTHVSIPDSCKSIVQKARFLDLSHPKTWNEFRCELISSMVKEIADRARKIKPGILINVHVVPWRNEDFGGANIKVAAQDLEKIAANADFISPMCYSQMLKQDAIWISSVVADMNNRAANKILPSIQVYPYYIESRFTPEDFRDCVKAALKAPSQGVVFWSWPLFEKDPQRKKIMEEIDK